MEAREKDDRGKETRGKNVKRICGGIITVAVLLIVAYYVTTDRVYTPVNEGPSVFRSHAAETKSQPHIVYILADDLGWNDVSYHGSRIKTPTIDRLASEGVKLEKFYMNSICTPSRAALMSGRYVTHTGLQHLHIEVNQARGLSLNCTLLPQALRRYGYRNYMVGKWHLGFYKEQYLPHNRGFDKFFGIYPGQAGHTNHVHFGAYTLVEDGKPVWENSTYDTHLYVNKATQYVDQHLQDHPEKPMFLYVAFQAVHAPMTVPSIYSDQYANETMKFRKQLAGMATCMDEGIKNLTDHLKKAGIWNNTILFFSSDNGGHGVFGSSNSPLREGKASLYEGGVRGVAFATGRGIKPGRVSKHLMHITDIYPTLVGLARRYWTGKSAAPQASINSITSNSTHIKSTEKDGNSTKPVRIVKKGLALEKKVDAYMTQLDGHDMWNSISFDAPSPRKEVLLNIDTDQPRWGDSLYPDVYDTRIRSAIIVDNWKLLTGFPAYIFAQTYMKPKFDKRLNKTKNVQLFNLDKDPTEKHDLFFKAPEVVMMMLVKLRKYKATAVKPQARSWTSQWNPPRLHGYMLPWKS